MTAPSRDSKIVVEMRGTEDVETLAEGQRREIGAAETILEPVIGGQARGPDVVVVPGAEQIVLGHVAEGPGHGQASTPDDCD